MITRFISILLSMFVTIGLLAQPALAACPNPDNTPPVANSCMGEDGPIVGRLNCSACCGFRNALSWQNVQTHQAYACNDIQATNKVSITDLLSLNQPLYASGSGVCYGYEKEDGTCGIAVNNCTEGSPVVPDSPPCGCRCED